VKAFSQDLLLAIKKISNHLTAVLLPLAQKMYETRFQGITLQDKNTVIPDLYKELDEKMYILTSLNNQDNTQLIKIDKDFDKLYSLVSNGLKYVCDAYWWIYDRWFYKRRSHTNYHKLFI
jgi:hypothetical protein